MIGGFGGGTETRGTLHSLLLRSLRARDPFLLRWRLSSFGPLSFCFVGCHSPVSKVVGADVLGS